MREITTHKTHDGDRQPQVLASEGLTAGGAPDNYKVFFGDTHVHVPFVTLDYPGVTNEALLAIVIDRLEGFQAGPFACTENAAALDHARICLGELQERTRGRIRRGVEGHPAT